MGALPGCRVKQLQGGGRVKTDCFRAAADVQTCRHGPTSRPHQDPAAAGLCAGGNHFRAATSQPFLSGGGGLRRLEPALPASLAWPFWQWLSLCKERPICPHCLAAEAAPLLPSQEASTGALSGACTAMRSLQSLRQAAAAALQAGCATGRSSSQWTALGKRSFADDSASGGSGDRGWRR